MSRDNSNIRFEIPTQDKYPLVLTALHRYFIQRKCERDRWTEIFSNNYISILDEPGLSARGGYPDGLPKDIEEKYAGFLKDDVSVIALDGDLIVGVVVSCIEAKGHSTRKPTYEQLKSEMNEKHAMINAVCNDSIHSSDFFAQHPDCHRYIDLFAVGVHENYQRRGIASKLVEKSIEVSMFLQSNTFIHHFLLQRNREKYVM